MKKHLHSCLASILVCASVASYANAATTDDLQITKYNIHSETEVAEICLTLSAPINISNRASLLENITLEQGDKPVSINAHDLSLTPTQFCIQKIQRNRQYKLTIDDLPGEKGLGLASPFEIEFKAPDRKPKLSFAQTRTAQGAIPTISTPRLEAVNIKEAKITIYRISNPEIYAQAWKQHQQSAIAPSESLTFVREKGQRFWESDLALSDAPNQTQKVDIPLPETPNGLYFIAVVPRTTPSTIDADPKLVAGAWFIKSSFTLTSQVAPDNIFAFAKTNSAPASGIVIQMLNKDDGVIGEGVTGNDGLSKLPLPSNPNASPLIIGTTRSGDVVFLPVNTTQSASEQFVTTITTDRDFYSPGDSMMVTLSAKNSDGQTSKIERGTLRLIRPDQAQEAERALKSNEPGPDIETFQLPISAQTGNWTLAWQDSDGALLSKNSVRVQDTSAKMEIQASTERKFLEQNGELDLNVKLNGDNVAHQVGFASISPARPSFPAWPDYTFGLMPNDPSDNNHFDFITSTTGEARLRLPIKSSSSGAMQIKTEPKNVPSPNTIILPFRSQQGWIGIKQVAGNYPDEVALNIIALDENLKRRADNEVFYQIFEEGRNFEWKQVDGRWSYRPLPNHNRVRGGFLNLFANSDNILRWRANPGNYVVEISKSDGTILSQYNLHHNLNAKSPNDGDIMDLSSLTQTLVLNKQNQIILSLKKPAMVNLIVSDNITRQTINQAFPVGKNAITITPNNTWGNKILIQAQATIKIAGAEYKTESNTLNLSLTRPELDLTIQTEAKPRIVTGQPLSLPITIQNIKNQLPTFVSAIITPALSSTTSYTDKLPSIKLERIPVDKNGKATLSAPIPEFTGALKVSINAWNEIQSGTRASIFTATPSFVVKSDIPSAMIDGESRQTAIIFYNKAAPEGEYHYEIKTSEGIKITSKSSGLANMNHGSSRSLPLNLSAEGALYGTCSIEITGPERFRFYRSWPIMIQERTKHPTALGETLLIEPKQFLALKPSTPEDNKPTAWKGSGFPKTVISPIPPLTLLADLRTLLEETPFTTTEIAEWIVISKLWQKPVTTSGLNIDGLLEKLRAERLLKLMQRQNADGSFPAWPGKEDGNILSTSAAILALHDEPNNPTTEIAASRAIVWLQRKLENTWFEETERAEHAAGFLALAKTGHTDPSSLSYYADTSKDKSLPPLASAQLSLAFSMNKDEASSRFWLKHANEALSKSATENKPAVWELLAALSENQFSDWHELSDIVSKVPNNGISSNPEAFLRTMWALGQRAETWQFAINGTAKKQQGTRFLTKEEESSSITLQNNSNHSLFVVRREDNAPQQNPATLRIEQRFYGLDGARIDGANLKRGEIYITEVSGQYVPEKHPTIIQVYNGKGLQPIIPEGITAKALLNQYPWLGEDLTSWEGIDTDSTTTSFAVQDEAEHKENNRWKVAYLVRAERPGTPNALPIAVRSIK